MAGRRPVVILALTLLVLPELVLHASGKPIPTMAHGPKGDVEFETLTLNASDFRDGVKTGQRGLGLSALAAMTGSLKAQAPANLEFCAYLALYPSINATLDYGKVASRPIRLFTGTLDEATSITTVRGFAEKQRAGGADVKLFEYEGAHHAFDNPDFRAPLVATIGNTSFTVLYHAQAHARVTKDVKATLAEVFAKP